jgi:hypothetical protein
MESEKRELEGLKVGRAYLKRTDTTLDLSQKAKRAKERVRGTEGDGVLYGKRLGTLVDHMFAKLAPGPCRATQATETLRA